MKRGFTLAEVLITLGIIGIVAALTLPSLINEHKKKTTAIRLKSFYSLMNQAIRRAEADHGIMLDWEIEAYLSSDAAEKWFNTYLSPYLITLHQEKESTRDYKVALNNGSGFSFYIQQGGASMPIFYCTNYKHCRTENFNGKDTFLFHLIPSSRGGRIRTGYENYTREQLLSLCSKGNYDNPDINSPGRRHTCTRLIEYDGWEIKNDYPWEQSK